MTTETPTTPTSEPPAAAESSTTMGDRAPAAASRLGRALAGPRRRLFAAGVVAAMILTAVAFLLARALTSDDEPSVLAGPDNASFSVELAAGWRAASADELQALPSAPLAVARQEDGQGLLVVRLEDSAPRDFKAFTKRLDREFERRFGDFERRSARTLRVRAGAAYYYSYIRRRRGTVHSIVIVPAGRRSYTLNSVAQGGADDVARELGRMIVSFDA